MDAQLSSDPRLQDLDRLWNASDPKTSESSFRELLPIAEGVSDVDLSCVVELYTHIARAEGAQGKLPEARASLAKAESLLAGQPATYRISAKIRWLLETGRLYVLEKTPSQARIHFVEAWSLAINSAEDFLAVDVALMMATIEPQKLQQEWVVRAIGIAENSETQKTKRWLGSLYATLGWKMFDLRQYEKALESFQKALRKFKAHGSEREAFVAQWSIGKILRAQGKTEEALAIQKELLSELSIRGQRDGRLYEELAECLQTLNRASEAQLYFDLAYRELSVDEWVSDNQPVKLKRLKELGKVKELKR